MKRMGEDKVQISIPAQLYRKIEEYVAGNEEFKDVEEFVEFVLREVLSEEEQEPAYTPEEEEEIKKRLRSLGYI